jgi:hypothetical protein
MSLNPTDGQLFAPGSATGDIYAHLLRAAERLGPLNVETKKTCIHLVRRSAFAGVHPRKAAVLVTLKTAAAIASPRIRKLEQASKHRFHSDLLLESSSDIDAEFLGWLRAAYDLAG